MAVTPDDPEMTHRAIIRERAPRGQRVDRARVTSRGYRKAGLRAPFTAPASFRLSVSRWTRMKWSVKAVWAIALSRLGMWHPMQPRAESIGHVDALPRSFAGCGARDRVCCAAGRE